VTKLSTRRFASRDELDAALAERLRGTLATSAPTALMLSGGTTPLAAYRRLAACAPPHDARLQILFSDDRYVPEDSAASNYHQARPLLDALALPAAAVLRVRTALPLEVAAADYGEQLRMLLDSGVPITLGLLGLGADGHTASLFSLADLERARGRLAIAVHRPDGMSAVSVTPDFLARIEWLLFVVDGRDKDDALRALTAQDSNLIAWRAVQNRPSVELWTCSN